MEVLGLFKRETKKRNGAEWIVNVREGAILTTHVLRAPALDEAAAIKEAGELVAALEAGEPAPTTTDAMGVEDAMAKLVKAVNG